MNYVSYLTHTHEKVLLLEQIKSIVEEAGAGKSGISEADIKTILLDYYREYKNTGSVAYRGNPALLDRFSYKEMARKFAEVLNGIS